MENNNNLEELGNMSKSRREFLKFLGLSASTAAGAVLLEGAFSPEPACPSNKCCRTAGNVRGAKDTRDGKYFCNTQISCP